MSNPAEDDNKAEAEIVYGTVLNKDKQNHEVGFWLFLKRTDVLSKYFEFTALVVALVLNRLEYDQKYLWWIMGATVSFNFLAQTIHIVLYYIVNRCLKDKNYWPPVFPLPWSAENPGSGYSQHYKLFYFLKSLTIAYLGFMVFQEKLDDFFVFVLFFVVSLLLVFDLMFYLFALE